MENFMESLNKLKEVHEKEVLGLQNKLLELNSERCRDAQRVEELFAKNHQLREQQKALKENLRVLENRLRAGLCDRCMVTQEVARKRQLEFESSHLQSLQRICVLTNEMTRLKEENKMLKEEVKQLRSLEDRPMPVAREGASDSPSPALLPSPSSWKAVPEKPQGGREEAGEDPPGADKSATCRTSPVAKSSQGSNLPESRAPGMSPQRISNQLHATVAVLQPGSRACLVGHSPSDGTSPPPNGSSPSSPGYEHSLPLDSLLRASGASVPAYEPLKRPLQADRFCLLNRPLSLHLQSPNSRPLASATALHGPQPWALKAGEVWEEPTSLLGLPNALVGMQDPRLEGALHLLLAQRQLCALARAGADPLRSPPPPRATPPSPPVDSDSESPELEVAGAALATAALPGGQHLPPTGGSPRKEAVAIQDYAPDKPLDLSDPGRSKVSPNSASQSGPLSPKLTHPGSPEPLTLPRPMNHNTKTLSNGTQGATESEPELEGPPTPMEPSQPLLGVHLSLLTATGTRCEPRKKPRPAPVPQSPQAATPPEPSKAGVQRPESEELDESDTSDSEVVPLSETRSKLSTPGEEHRCFCPQEPRQGLQLKRKQPALDPANKASKKTCRGRRRAREPTLAAEEPDSPRDAKDRSPSPGNNGHEET
ncbi:RBBP8 N-terminal-like protein [Cavia porcellus]|uniref:RBBP8 N-terminal like n=1 Tax=Cavia porcellus TaxID=10141 RepID=A0A286Y5A3_CAVPO|nr:RBBP8 N-terminal-like protein isoform X2 [Cavia porcellus]